MAQRGASRTRQIKSRSKIQTSIAARNRRKLGAEARSASRYIVPGNTASMMSRASVLNPALTHSLILIPQMRGHDVFVCTHITIRFGPPG
jgi:hypothetical protein